MIRNETLRAHLADRAALCREDARIAGANCYRYTSEADAENSLAEAAEIDSLLSDCPAPDLPPGNRCDGCDCERAAQ